MPRPVCLHCRRFLKVKKNGVVIEEGMPLTNDQSGPWGPYKLWMADLWACPTCGVEIVMGFGHGPISEHYKPDYIVTRANCEALGELLPARVDDC